MPWSSDAALKKAGSDFVKRLKDEPKEAETQAREVLKKLGPLEKATAAFDKGLAAKDAKAIRGANADVTNAIKTLAGFCQVLNANLKKAGHADAGGIVGWFLGDLTNEVQQRCQLEADKAIEALAHVLKLPATTFSGDWKEAKKRFEALTGKKKPSATFLAVYRKSSGLDDACAAMDKASKANNVPDFRKALTNFVKSSNAYMEMVRKEHKIAIDRKNVKDGVDDTMEVPTYKACVEALLGGINKIRIHAIELLKAAEKK